MARSRKGFGLGRVRISLKAVLGAVCSIAVVLAFWAVPVLHQRWAVEQIRRVGGFTDRDPPGMDVLSRPSNERAPSAPDWLRALTGEGMRTVIIQNRDLTHSNVLEHVSRMTNLESLSLSGSAFDERELKVLQNCKSLRFLFLHDTLVSDDGISFVRHFENLKQLGLARTQVTDNGLKDIAQCTNLNYLCLIETGVGDEAVPFLARLTNLRELELRGAKFTDGGIEKLQAALPDCKITH